MGGSYVIAARVHAELGSHGNGGAKEEKDIEQIEGDRDDGMTGERLIERGQSEVDQRQQRESCYEHNVVDQRWIAREGHGNDIADEGRDNDHQEEL